MLTNKKSCDILSNMNYSNPESRDLVPYMDNAQAEGNLSDESRRLLENPQVQRMLRLSSGTPAADVEGDDLTILTILADNSYSMHRNVDAVINGQHKIIDTVLKNSPRPNSVLISTQVLNGQYDRDLREDNPVVDPYRPLAEAVRLDRRNFVAEGDTPLVPRTIEVLGSVLLKAQEGRDAWKDSVRTMTLIMSDGGDTSGIDPREAAALSANLQTGRHIVGYMGFGDYDFQSIFVRMGAKKEWILTADSSEKDILEALGIWAVAAARATSEDKFPLLLNSGFEGLRNLNPGQ